MTRSLSRRWLHPTAALLLAGAALGVLAACASVPDLGPAPQAKPAASYAATASFAASATAWPTDKWWTAYGDAGLDALMDEALAGSPDLAQAAARVRQPLPRALIGAPGFDDLPVGLRAQIAEAARTLLPLHPRMKELAAQLALLDGQIRDAAAKNVRILENDARLAMPLDAKHNAFVDPLHLEYLVRRSAPTKARHQIIPWETPTPFPGSAPGRRPSLHAL